MYKSKLQELCCKKSWPLPKYSAIKNGPDHKPLFKASVFVNGAFFDSPTSYGSSKQAHNEAAKVAFTHFVSPGPNHPPSPPVLPVRPTSDLSPGSVISSSEAKDGIKIKLTGKNSEICPQITDDEEEKKSELTSKAKEHAKGKDSGSAKGRAFEVSKSFDTAAEAETNVASMALSSLSLEELPKDSKLQKFAQTQRGDPKSKKKGNTNATNVHAGTSGIKGKNL